MSVGCTPSPRPSPPGEGGTFVAWLEMVRRAWLSCAGDAVGGTPTATRGTRVLPGTEISGPVGTLALPSFIRWTGRLGRLVRPADLRRSGRKIVLPFSSPTCWALQ